MKTRLELECVCKICDLKFVIYDNLFPKEVGSGCHIGEFVCPNCTRSDLDFDIVRRGNK